MTLRICLLWALSIVWAGTSLSSSAAGEFQLSPQTTVSFAGVERARAILTNRDDFIRSLSPIDRAARMKVDPAPSESVFLGFLSTNALAWTDAETNRLVRLLTTLSGKMAPFHLPMPARIELVKTSGREEGQAAYTRANAVLLPPRQIRSTSEDLLAHELFHILSRQNPELRKRLYRIVGFEQIPDVALPGDLARLKLTNPDGVQSVMIRVRLRDQSMPVMPILYSSAARVDNVQGGEFFDHLVFKLLPLREAEGTFSARTSEGAVELLAPEEVTGFYEQIGRNTKYIIHPDEILADNFVHLLHQTPDLPTPRIVADLKRLLLAPD